MVRVQHPISTVDSEPEPDLAIVRTDRYNDSHPRGGDIAVVIEIADSSLVRDRTTKQRLYAAASVPRYMIINLNGPVVEMYTEPVADPAPRYATMRTVSTGALDLGALMIDVAELLGPPT